MAEKKQSIRQWQYVGDGVGIPGLPHLITEEEARSLGVLDALDAARKNGSYRPVGSSEPAAPKEE